MTARKNQHEEQPADDANTLIEGYIAMRNFLFGGVQYKAGQPISVAVYKHRRFENLLHTRYVKAV